MGGEERVWCIAARFVLCYESGAFFFEDEALHVVGWGGERLEGCGRCVIASSRRCSVLLDGKCCGCNSATSTDEVSTLTVADRNTTLSVRV